MTPTLQPKAAHVYCEDCAHCYVPPVGKRYARCLRLGESAEAVASAFVSRDFDVGGDPEQHAYCATQRIGDCGPRAKWFQPRRDVSEPNRNELEAVSP